MAKSKGYFGLGWLISVILAILPTNIILGIVTRAKRGKILLAILNLILCPLFYILDLITIILKGDVTLLT